MPYTNPIPALPDDVIENKAQKTISTSPKGYPVYEDIYFAFVDVLGFRQTFDEHREDPKKHFAKGYEDVFGYFSFLLGHANFMKKTTTSYAGQTSDSLYFYTDRSDYLTDFIKIYYHFSLYAMSQNVFFRGGIAKGCLFINEPYQFYGDAVIKAYLLEEKISKYPQIALDGDTYEVLKDTPDLSESIRLDEQAGRYFLEPFFRITKNELAAITDLSPEQIKNVKKNEIIKYIKKGKKRFEFDERNYPKYNFLSQSIDKLNRKKEFDAIFE